MIYIDKSKPLDVPEEVATCPECRGELWLEIEDFTEEGEITEGGFNINCVQEHIDLDRWARDWLPVERKIHQWLLDNVRIADATESTLKEWNESIRDWVQ